MLTKASPRAGKLIVQQAGLDGFSAFIPTPLPPNPPLKYDDEIKILVEKANRALGRLDGATYMLPNPDLFLYMYVRKEAVLSSQIEGTQTSLAELLEYEGESKDESTPDDVKEVSNYVSAMSYGLDRLKELPLSLRLIREIHAILLKDTRGGHRSPGEFRTTQNWIGGTMPSNARFVPPPANEVLTCMGQLEKFLHDRKGSTPPLIKAGLAHAQFETIHPFLDGNGRVGRLLITFILCHDKIIEKPLLYLSLYFKQFRDEYYERLTAIRRDGDWEGWIKFYLQGIYDISQQATKAAKLIMNLQSKDRVLVNTLGKASPTAFRLLDLLFEYPVISSPSVSKKLELSPPAARRAINNLEQLGILKEISGKKRDRLYAYDAYVEIIREGTEL
ncbi:MAG: Fic family protein [Eubacteriales bacterium]